MIYFLQQTKKPIGWNPMDFSYDRKLRVSAANTPRTLEPQYRFAAPTRNQRSLKQFYYAYGELSRLPDSTI